MTKRKAKIKTNKTETKKTEAKKTETKKSEDTGVGSLGRQRRMELAWTLGYEGKSAPPPWGQLLREVKSLMKDSEDLKTARRILRF